MISKQENVYDRDTSYQHPTRMLLRRSIQHFKFYTEPRTTKFCKYSITKFCNYSIQHCSSWINGGFHIRYATASVPSAATISSALECYSVSVSLLSTATSDIYAERYNCIYLISTGALYLSIIPSLLPLERSKSHLEMFAH